MKIIKLGLLLLLSTITNAYATTEGMYLGVQGGQSNTHNTAQVIAPSPNPPPPPPSTVMPSSSKGFGVRVYVGYLVNQYAGMEFGYMSYASTGYQSFGAIRQNAWDLTGRGIYPFGKSGFAIFGKAGFAFATERVQAGLTGNGVGVTNNGYLPVYGIGMTYDFNPHWVLDLTATRMQHGDGIKDADFISIGISYHVVNDRCGQFLC